MYPFNQKFNSKIIGKDWKTLGFLMVFLNKLECLKTAILIIYTFGILLSYKFNAVPNTNIPKVFLTKPIHVFLNVVYIL